MTYVFINKRNPHRIKMIEARCSREAKIKLAERLGSETNSGSVFDYKPGFLL